MFEGNVVFTVPHMNEGVLACGGMITRLPAREKVHFIYTTDGSRSPLPALRRVAPEPECLPEIRIAEAESALCTLGVPRHNLYFLDFPDGSLRENMTDLRNILVELYDRLQPRHVFLPFRYHCHPDHPAVHEAGLQALRYLSRDTAAIEYFVYYRWWLIPGGDVRRFVRPEHLVQVDIQEQSYLKKRALECFRSQTTCYFSWQDRPVLPPRWLNETCSSPERLLLRSSTIQNTTVFAALGSWIRLVHRLEPCLHHAKDRLLFIARYVLNILFRRR